MDINTDLREVLCLQPFLKLKNCFGKKSIDPIEFRRERFAVIEMIGERIFARKSAPNLNVPHLARKPADQ